MLTIDKEIIGWIGLVLSLISYAPYLYSMRKGTTRPHAFSWFLWALLSAIAYWAQVVSGAGSGAWVTGITALFCFIIGACSLSVGEKNITRSDWVTFLCGLAAIPVWHVTKDPLWAMIIVTVIMALSYFPTARKSWIKPHEEQILMFLLSGIRFLLSFFALERMNLINAMLPLTVAAMDFSVVLMLVLRRKRALHG